MAHLRVYFFFSTTTYTRSLTHTLWPIPILHVPPTYIAVSAWHICDSWLPIRLLVTVLLSAHYIYHVSHSRNILHVSVLQQLSYSVVILFLYGKWCGVFSVSYLHSVLLSQSYKWAVSTSQKVVVLFLMPL